MTPSACRQLKGADRLPRRATSTRAQALFAYPPGFQSAAGFRLCDAGVVPSPGSQGHRSGSGLDGEGPQPPRPLARRRVEIGLAPGVAPVERDVDAGDVAAVSGKSPAMDRQRAVGNIGAVARDKDVAVEGNR